MAQSYLVVALVAGLVVGVALGGRPRHLAAKHFRWWALLPLGLVLQQVVEARGVPAPFAILVVSYVYLIGFCAANLHHRGMGVVLIGISLNLVAISANHGMPVRESAVRIAHGSPMPAAIRIHEVKHHLEDRGTRLPALGDIIPVAAFRQVLSFGDLVLAVGVVDLLVHLLRPAGPARRRRTRLPSDTDDDRADDDGLAAAPLPTSPALIDLTALERSAPAHVA